MLTLLNPIDDPQAWDSVIIAGRQSPGLAQIGDVAREYEWDVKVGKGAFGSTTTFTGRVPAKFSIAFTLWTQAHFSAWEDFVERLKYNPAKIKYNPETLFVSGVTAVDIFHPALVELDINSVVVQKIGGLVHKGRGVYTASIDFLEYYPPPKLSVVATPAGSTPIDGLPPDPAQTALEAQIAQLTAAKEAAYAK